MASDESEGCWLTPDLLGGDITNPQSLNRYAYALNNPTTLTDPSGLDPCTFTYNPDGSVTTNCTVTAGGAYIALLRCVRLFR